MIPLYDKNPAQRRPVVTQWLIGANILFFVLEWLSGGGSWAAQYGFVPARAHESFSGELPQVLSGMFLHANLAHLGWNMLFLHIFGDNVEDLLGRGRYLAFYLLGGLGAAFGHYFIEPTSTLPMIGASGAIGGVLGGYLVLHPRAPVVLLNPIPLLWLVMGPLMALPAWAVVGYWFIGNLFGGVASLGTEGGGVAFFAHLGGFVTGLVLTRPLLLDRSVAPRDRWDGFRTEARRPGTRRIFWKTDDRPFWR